MTALGNCKISMECCNIDFCFMCRAVSNNVKRPIKAQVNRSKIFSSLDYDFEKAAVLYMHNDSVWDTGGIEILMIALSMEAMESFIVVLLTYSMLCLYTFRHNEGCMDDFCHNRVYCLFLVSGLFICVHWVEQEWLHSSIEGLLLTTCSSYTMDCFFFFPLDFAFLLA